MIDTDERDDYSCPHCGGLQTHSFDCITEQEPTYDIGTCQTCGAYGEAGNSCRNTQGCREYGSEYM